MRKMMQSIRTAAIAIGLVCSAACGAALGSERPTPEDLVEKPGGESLARRMARAQFHSHRRTAPHLATPGALKILRAKLEAAGVPEIEAADRLLEDRPSLFSPMFRSELDGSAPTSEARTLKTLTILVDFADHRAADEGLTRAGVEANVYGSGTLYAKEWHRPYESVRSYYRRASQRKLELEGNVLEHHFAENRANYEPAAPGDDRADLTAWFDMASEALDAIEAAEDHDFAQYDNDDDDDIDLCTILYAGGRDEWGDFWWAYQSELGSIGDGKYFDGKKLNQIIFASADVRGQGDFDPKTLIHEAGHAFGLADYYDTLFRVGTAGGVGGLDMMDGGYGNHCAFSRWLLDWIDPVVVGSGAPRRHALSSSSRLGGGTKAIAIFPSLDAAEGPQSELFLLEHRERLLNDHDLPADGLLVWHIDASMTSPEDGFWYDNAATAVKLLRLVRPDNEYDFGRDEYASESDFFAETFDPASSAQTFDDYDEFDWEEDGETGIVMKNLKKIPRGMALTIGFEGETSAPEPPPQEALAQADDAAPLDSEQEAKRTTEARLASARSLLDDLLSDEPDPQPLTKLERLRKEVLDLPPQEIASLYREAVEKPVDLSDAPAVAAVELVATVWASKAGRPAAEALLGLESAELRDRIAPTAMKAWLADDPQEALDWRLASAEQAARLVEPEFVRQAFEFAANDDLETTVEKLKRVSGKADAELAVRGILEFAEQAESPPSGLRERVQAAILSNPDLDLPEQATRALYNRVRSSMHEEAAP